MKRFTNISRFLILSLVFTTLVIDPGCAQTNALTHHKKTISKNKLTPNSAFYPGNAQLKSYIENPNSAIKTSSGIQKSAKQGGEDASSAVPIENIPFHAYGTTEGYLNDYDEICPYGGNAPDVVYSFIPDIDISVNMNLCAEGTYYDTKLIVYENEVTIGIPYACNDDACENSHTEYLSKIDNISLFAGQIYYIVVDGYGNSFGEYELYIIENNNCQVDCPPGGIEEGEPVPGDDYVDHFNGGCGSEPVVFSNINCGETYCGNANTYFFEGANYRDTDWYTLDLTDGVYDIAFTAIAEFPVIILIIDAGPGDCYSYEILESGTADCGQEITISETNLTGNYYLWIAPNVFEGYPGEQNYVISIDCFPQGSTLEGNLLYFNNETPMNNVLIDSGGFDSDYTDADGYFGPVNVPDGPLTLIPSHEKEWKIYNIMDILILSQYLATGAPAFAPIQLMAADVTDGDGIGVDALDVLLLRQKLSNNDLLPEWQSPDWLYYDVNVIIEGNTIHDFKAIMTGDVNGSNIPEQ